EGGDRDGLQGEARAGDGGAARGDDGEEGGVAAGREPHTRRSERGQAGPLPGRRRSEAARRDQQSPQSEIERVEVGIASFEEARTSLGGERKVAQGNREKRLNEIPRVGRPVRARHPRELAAL